MQTSTASATRDSTNATGNGPAVSSRPCCRFMSSARSCSSTNSGRSMEVVDGLSSEVRSAQIFVALLGASNYTYGEAVAAGLATCPPKK